MTELQIVLPAEPPAAVHVALGDFLALTASAAVIALRQ